MDYVVGSVAALISGNVTPNRPRLIKRALTPTKHQPSPNVTPKSEFVDDRSIFLSPTLQKKKAIVKKSPKRIFQNPDPDAKVAEVSSKITKTEKVKKHLKDELDVNFKVNSNIDISKSPKKLKDKLGKSLEPSKSPKKNKKLSESDELVIENLQNVNETTPKKNKKRSNSLSAASDNVSIDDKENVICTTSDTVSVVIETQPKSPSKRKHNKSLSDAIENTPSDVLESSVSTEITHTIESPVKSPQKNKKLRDSVSEEFDNQLNNDDNESKADGEDNIGVNNTNKQPSQKKNRKRTKKSKKVIHTDLKEDTNEEINEEVNLEPKSKKKKKNIVNPNAITTQDTDSEHDSDDQIESDNETSNKEVLDTGEAESSEEDETEVEKKPEKQKKETQTDEEKEEEVKRTLFVGNVPFSDKCKKEIKRIFNQFGEIETVRIRTVPVKDARSTPKLAVIKKDLHPERSTVNVYVKYKHPDSVNKALSANNMVLKDHHLRVSRSDTTGAAHDSKLSVFVGNIPFGLEDDALREKFLPCGEIHSVRIVRDRVTNAGKGFGYVNFESKDGVELALALPEEDLTIKNRILRVKRCSQNTPKQSNDKPRGNQRFQGNPRQGNGPGGNQRFQGNQQVNDRPTGNQRFQGNQRQFNDGPRGNQRFQGNQRQFNDGPKGNQRFQGNQRQFNDGPRGNQRFQSNQKQFNDGPRGNIPRGKFQGNQRQGNDSSTVNPRFQGNQKQTFERKGGFQGRGGGVEDGRNEGILPDQHLPKEQGAYRRIKKKKQDQDAAEGPASKIPKTMDLPKKEKKTKKEFVGMTGEKKKKFKPKKGEKKKRVLSEILTKHKIT